GRSARWLPRATGSPGTGSRSWPHSHRLGEQADDAAQQYRLLQPADLKVTFERVACVAAWDGAEAFGFETLHVVAAGHGSASKSATGANTYEPSPRSMTTRRMFLASANWRMRSRSALAISGAAASSASTASDSRSSHVGGGSDVAAVSNASAAAVMACSGTVTA